MAGFLDYEDVKRVYSAEVKRTGSLDQAFSDAVLHAYTAGLSLYPTAWTPDGMCRNRLVDMAKHFYADKMSTDTAGRGRIESAFYATVKQVFAWGIADSGVNW